MDKVKPAADSVLQDALDKLAGGTPEERDAALRIHAALQTPEGRRAAGLKRRARGRTYDAGQIGIDSPIMWLAVRFYAGTITEQEATDGIIDAMDALDMDLRTATGVLSELKPRAEGVIRLLKASGYTF